METSNSISNMKNSDLIYKSKNKFFGITFFLLCFISLLYTLFLMALSEPTLDKYQIFQIIIISIIYLFLFWLLIATEVRYVYIYDDRVEIHHPFYHKRFKWSILYNQDIMKVGFSGGGNDGPEIFIVKKKRRGLFGLKRCGFIVLKIEDRKIVLNHFNKLNIPIKIYSEAIENQHLIDK